MKRELIRYTLLDSGLTATYIIGIALFLNNVEHIFNSANTKDTILAPIIMLLLFIISAAITGWLVLGRPIMWYIEGQKKDAITLFFSTIATLFVLLLAFILIRVSL